MDYDITLTFKNVSPERLVFIMEECRYVGGFPVNEIKLKESVVLKKSVVERDFEYYSQHFTKMLEPQEREFPSQRILRSLRRGHIPECVTEAETFGGEKIYLYEGTVFNPSLPTLGWHNPAYYR